MHIMPDLNFCALHSAIAGHCILHSVAGIGWVAAHLKVILVPTHPTTLRLCVVVGVGHSHFFHLACGHVKHYPECTSHIAIVSLLN